MSAEAREVEAHEWSARRVGAQKKFAECALVYLNFFSIARKVMPNRVAQIKKICTTSGRVNRVGV
jgi:hypothetical protein